MLPAALTEAGTEGRPRTSWGLTQSQAKCQARAGTKIMLFALCLGDGPILTTLLSVKTLDPPRKVFSQPKPQSSLVSAHSPPVLVLKTQLLRGSIYLRPLCGEQRGRKKPILKCYNPAYGSDCFGC